MKTFSSIRRLVTRLTSKSAGTISKKTPITVWLKVRESQGRCKCTPASSLVNALRTASQALILTVVRSARVTKWVMRIRGSCASPLPQPVNHSRLVAPGVPGRRITINTEMVPKTGTTCASTGTLFLSRSLSAILSSLFSKLPCSMD